MKREKYSSGEHHSLEKEKVNLEQYVLCIRHIDMVGGQSFETVGFDFGIIFLFETVAEVGASL